MKPRAGSALAAADDHHFALAAASAFAADASDVLGANCPTPDRCAACGCRGLCLTRPAA